MPRPQKLRLRLQNLQASMVRSRQAVPNTPAARRFTTRVLLATQVVMLVAILGMVFTTPKSDTTGWTILGVVALCFEALFIVAYHVQTQPPRRSGVDHRYERRKIRHPG